jgi:hypothetical protein
VYMRQVPDHVANAWQWLDDQCAAIATTDAPPKQRPQHAHQCIQGRSLDCDIDSYSAIFASSIACSV